MVTGGRTRPEQPPVYPPGTVLAGKYRVERTLGEGGFGIVLAALHEQLDERVAIKILLPQAAAHPTAPSRFVREARAAAKIRSEHVARVKDVGTLGDSAAGGGTPYMVMEYLEGEDLASLVKRAGPQPIADVCEWVLQACEAIAEAHGLGMVHRDLKPANLFITRRIDGSPCVKVLDFGISKLATDGADKGMTGTAEVMGSPFYMSPEQMKSTRDVDVRADVWALGTILFELLAGAPPFDGETMTGLIVAIMQEPPRDLAAYRPDVPPALRDAVLRCMQKDPAARWQDVLQLAHAIAPFAHARAHGSLQRIAAALGNARSPHAPASVPLSGTTAGTPAGMTAIPATVPSAMPAAAATSSEFSRSVQTGRRGRSPVVWVAVGAGALLAIGGMVWARQQLRGVGDVTIGYTLPDPSASGAGAAAPAPVPAGDVVVAPPGASAAADPAAPVATPSGSATPEDPAPSADPKDAASAPTASASASARPPAVPPLGHRPGPLRSPPPPPPPPPTSEPAAPSPPKPPSDPFGRPI